MTCILLWLEWQKSVYLSKIIISSSRFNFHNDCLIALSTAVLSCTTSLVTIVARIELGLPVALFVEAFARCLCSFVLLEISDDFDSMSINILVHAPRIKKSGLLELPTMKFAQNTKDAMASVKKGVSSILVLVVLVRKGICWIDIVLC